MESINLTHEEIQQVTGRVKACAQLKWFRENGFIAMVRADGRPLVSRAHFELKMGGLQEVNRSVIYEPDLGALDGTKTSSQAE